MIEQKQPFDQLPKEIKPAFQELNVLKHLNAAGFKKKFGFTCAALFRLVFVPLFHQKNWFRLLESNKGETFPAMVKNDNKRYLVGGERLCLKALYAAAPQIEGKNRNILPLIRTELAPGIPVTVVFVRHRSKKNEWLAILSTDLTLIAEEIIRIYRMRWEIEVFFKCAKSLLRLQKEFQGRSYDLLISHTTIVFTRYMLIAWQHRQSTNQRSLGGLFYLLCDEVGTLDWAVALQQLVELINEIVTKTGKKITTLIQRQLQQWMAGLPNYIKAYLPILSCES